MVPGHSLGQGTGVQRYGASECQMSLSLAGGCEGYKVVVVVVVVVVVRGKGKLVLVLELVYR